MARHDVHELLADVVLLLKDPIAPRAALKGISHQRVGAAATLHKTIISKAWITIAESDWTLLIACAMATAILVATKVGANTSLLAVAILVAEVTRLALVTELASEVGMTVTHMVARVIFLAVCCSDQVARASRGTHAHVS